MDVVMVKTGGKRMWLWRAVQDESEVMDMLVQRPHNAHADMKLFRRLLRHYGVHLEAVATDKLGSTAWR